MILFLLEQLPPPTAVPSSLFPEAAFTLPVIAAIGALITLVIGSLTTGIVSIITALKVAKIEAHVNSEKTAQEGREALLKREAELLREMLADKKLAASLLAQATAQRARAPGQVALPPVTDHLEQIDKNTAATAANTAPGKDPV